MRMYFVTKITLMILVVFNVINCYKSILNSSPTVGLSSSSVTFANSIPSYTQVSYQRQQETIVFDTSCMTIGTISRTNSRYPNLNLPTKLLKEIRLTMNHIDSLNGAIKENIQASSENQN